MLVICKHLFILTVLFSSAIAQWENLYSQDHSLEKGKILHKLPILPKEWKLSFELMPTGFLTDVWGNVIHVGDPQLFGTTHNYHGMPSIYIGNDCHCNQPKVLRFHYHANGVIGTRNTNTPQLNQWTKIEVSQLLVANQYRLTFSVNGFKVGSDLNRSPQEFKDVNLYASSSTYAPQPGKIRNLVISRPRQGGCLELIDPMTSVIFCH